MNIRCIFGHKWEFYRVDRKVEYNLPTINKSINITIHDDVRMCKRCYKKQKAINTPFTDRVTGWMDVELTKDELRDKKLKELGI